MSESASYKNLLAVVEHAVDGIITINQKGLIEMANPAVTRLFGYISSEMKGRNVNMLMPNPHKTNHDQYLVNYLSTGKAKIIGIGREVEGQRKDGSTFPFRLSISEVELESGLKMFTGIIHDITEIKEAESKLKQLNKHLESRVDARTEELSDAVNRLLGSNSKLQSEILQRELAEKKLLESQLDLEEALKKEQELNALKSKFLTLASHEFRTPLTTILSSATLIGRYQDTESQTKRTKHLNRIQDSVRQLTSILDDFLSVSKLEEGHIHIKIAECEISNIIEDICQIAKETMEKEGDINILNKLTSNTLKTDKKAIQHIVSNLLSNAIKYSNSPIEVNIELKTEVQYFTLSISDKGIGIPKAEQQHLFERFFRASNSESIPGTGLGLHIIREYVELLKGEINFASEQNRGSQFTIKLPLTYE
jgi:two-component system sensor kinase FixL